MGVQKASLRGDITAESHRRHGGGQVRWREPIPGLMEVRVQGPSPGGWAWPTVDRHVFRAAGAEHWLEAEEASRGPAAGLWPWQHMNRACGSQSGVSVYHHVEWRIGRQHIILAPKTLGGSIVPPPPPCHPSYKPELGLTPPSSSMAPVGANLSPNLTFQLHYLHLQLSHPSSGPSFLSLLH